MPGKRTPHQMWFHLHLPPNILFYAVEASTYKVGGHQDDDAYVIALYHITTTLGKPVMGTERFNTSHVMECGLLSRHPCFATLHCISRLPHSAATPVVPRLELALAVHAILLPTVRFPIGFLSPSALPSEFLGPRGSWFSDAHPWLVRDTDRVSSNPTPHILHGKPQRKEKSKIKSKSTNKQPQPPMQRRLKCFADSFSVSRPSTHHMFPGDIE